jgi:hypothetical protein
MYLDEQPSNLQTFQQDEQPSNLPTGKKVIDAN